MILVWSVDNTQENTYISEKLGETKKKKILIATLAICYCYCCCCCMQHVVGRQSFISGVMTGYRLSLLLFLFFAICFFVPYISTIIMLLVNVFSHTLNSILPKL